MNDFIQKLEDDLEYKVYYYDGFIPPDIEEMTDKHGFEENSLIVLKYFAKNVLSQSIIIKYHITIRN